MDIRQIFAKHPHAETELLLGYILSKPKEFLLAHGETKVSAHQEQRLKGLLARRKRGEPMAYLLGYKDFCGLRFAVSPAVLIPRPETEWLVERAVEIIRARLSGDSVSSRGRSGMKAIQILDLGTGSGCIAVSLYRALAGIKSPGFRYRIIASDISRLALRVAAANAQVYRARVKFVQSDLFTHLPGRYDLVLANLPYVPVGMYELLKNHLGYEPKIAITDGSETWEVYGKFFAVLDRHLARRAAALLEIDDGSRPALRRLLRQHAPNLAVKFYKDLGQRWRYLELRKP